MCGSHHASLVLGLIIVKGDIRDRILMHPLITAPLSRKRDHVRCLSNLLCAQCNKDTLLLFDVRQKKKRSMYVAVMVERQVGVHQLVF